MQTLVSILIPAYNAQRWLAQTIESAIAQTWPHKEIIVVDDGSTDRTLAVARKFERDAVRVVTQTNQGAAAARNQAFSLSRGDYIQWLDADDLLSRDKIAKQMEAAEKCQNKRTLFSSGWGYFMYRSSKARFVPTCLWSDLSPVEWLVRKMSQNLHMMNATWLVSRELTEAAGPWNTRLSLDDDGEYFCRVLLASTGTQFLVGAKSYYRMSGFNTLSNVDFSDKKLESLWLSMQLHIGYLRSLEDSERTRSACLTFLQYWLKYFHPDRPDVAREAQQLAASLGGRLSLPKAPWKYAWIERLFGFGAAKHTQSHYNRGKSFVLGAWDRMMQSFERDRVSPG